MACVVHVAPMFTADTVALSVCPDICVDPGCGCVLSVLAVKKCRRFERITLQK